MKRRSRIYYKEEQKALMWDRCQKSKSLGSIARLFNRHYQSIERIIREGMVGYARQNIDDNLTH